MKLLIFLLLSFPIFAQVKNEMPDDDVSKQFVAGVKDSEFEDMLKKTNEFGSCYEDHKFDQKDVGNDAAQQKKIDDASVCFKKKLDNGGEKKLKELEQKLDLENLGLVKSKNVRDITEYLTDKMYKALTGYERQEKDQKKLIESMKYSNRKMIDQSVFIDLYKTKLTKSIMQEISSYCFKDFRNSDTTKKSFAEHWAGKFGSTTETYNDLGEPSFDVDASQFDLTDPSKNYQSILNTISQNAFGQNELHKFIVVCMKQIHKLCEAYKPTAGAQTQKPTTGGRSCLVRANLTNLRKAMADANLVAKQFKDMDGKGVALMLDQGQQAKFYDPNKNNQTVDDLTTRTSKDILEGNSDKTLVEHAKKCEQYPTDPDCEKFLLEKDNYDKAEYDTRMQLTLKRDIEMERIKELVKGDAQKLKDYLKDKGYLGILEQYEKDPSNTNVENLIGVEFDKRRDAAIAEMKKNVGNRQVRADDVKKTPTMKDKNIKDNATITLSERARLAQVVMFNNIILGSVQFEDDKGNKLGTISSGLRKEVADQESNNSIQSDFFSDVKNTADSGGQSISKETIDGGQIVDMIFKP